MAPPRLEHVLLLLGVLVVWPISTAVAQIQAPSTQQARQATTVAPGATTSTSSSSALVPCSSVFKCSQCSINPDGCLHATALCFFECSAKGYSSPDAACFAGDRMCSFITSQKEVCQTQSNCEACTARSGSGCRWYETIRACFGAAEPFKSGLAQCGNNGNTDTGESSATTPVPPPTTLPPVAASPTVTEQALMAPKRESTEAKCGSLAANSGLGGSAGQTKDCEQTRNANGGGGRRRNLLKGSSTHQRGN